MNEEHTAPVMAMLERNYDVSGGDLAQQLADVAAKLAEEYWADHRRDILPIVDGSFLEEYDEYNIEVQFKSAAAVSITRSSISAMRISWRSSTSTPPPPWGRWARRSAR